MEVTTRPLTRQQLSEFLPNHRAIVAFETVQKDIGNQGDVFTTAPFVTTDENTNLGAARVLTGDADVTVTDDPALHKVTLGLTDKLTAGTVGDASHLVVLAFDAKGRLTAASQVALNSDNVTEGTTNLFFTQARARASISGSAGISYNAGTGVITLDQAFSRGLLSAGPGIDYNAATGVISLSPSGAAPGTYSPIISETVDTYGRVTAIS